jgi:hypothetical protein
MFDKKQLLEMYAPKVVSITVDHDGKKVDLFVRELSAKQVFDLQRVQKNNPDHEMFSIQLVAQALCDEKGNLVLTEEDARELAGMKVGAFSKLSEAVAKGIGLEMPKPKTEGGEKGNV